MIGFVLLTAVTITLTNGIPIEVNSPYLEYPEEYKEDYKNHNYFNLPKTSYELRPQLRSDSKRANTILPNYVEKYYPESIRRHELPEATQPSTVESTKPPSIWDFIDKGKRSFKTPELYEKLIALGLDYIEVTNIIEALHRMQRKIDDKNVQ